MRGTCALCGRHRRLTVDHIVPRVFGGDNSPTNLRMVCEPCNTRRGHGIDEQVWRQMTPPQRAKLKHWCFGEEAPITQEWSALLLLIVARRVPGFRI